MDVKRTLLARKKVIITLSGTDGSAVIGGLGQNKTIDFTENLMATATAFVVDNSADYLDLGVVLTSAYESLFFTEKVDGSGFTDPTIENSTADLTGIVYSTLYPEPVTLDEMKEFLLNRADIDVKQDALITELIKSARELAEQFCNRSLIPQEIEFTESVSNRDFSGNPEFTLPYPNHIEVEQVKVNGEVTTDYTLLGINRFTVQFNTRYYSSGLVGNTYYVKYTAGECTSIVKNAIMQICKDMYENRGKDPMSSNGFIMLNSQKVY